MAMEDPDERQGENMGVGRGVHCAALLSAVVWFAVVCGVLLCQSCAVPCFGKLSCPVWCGVVLCCAVMFCVQCCAALCCAVLCHAVICWRPDSIDSLCCHFGIGKQGRCE